MPVVITFDIEGAEPIERNRIQSFFERLVGKISGEARTDTGSSYRYSRLGTDQPVAVATRSPMMVLCAIL